MNRNLASRRLFCQTFCQMLGAAATLGMTNRAAVAQESEEAALIRKVVESTGGIEAIRGGANCRRSATGKLIDPQGEILFKEDLLTGGKDRFRFTLNLNNVNSLTLALNGNQGWNGTAGKITALPPDRLKNLQQESTVMHLATLLPLAEGKFKTRLLGVESILGRDAVGLEIQVEGQRPVIFHFDKGKMVLVKRSYETVEFNKVVRKEIFHTEFEEFQGVKLPTKEFVNQDGKPFVEISSIKYTFYKTLDDSYFTKP